MYKDKRARDDRGAKQARGVICDDDAVRGLERARPRHPHRPTDFARMVVVLLVGLGLRVQGAGCRVQGAGRRLQGAGCTVQGAGCGVQGAGCRL